MPQVGIGNLPNSMFNPMPQGNAFVSTTVSSAPVETRAGQNSESVTAAPSESHHEVATATSGDSGGPERRSEGRNNASANAKSPAVQEQSTRPRENPMTVSSANDSGSPSHSQSRRRRREVDSSKPRARRRATKSDSSSSDESGSSSNNSDAKSSPSSATPKTGVRAPKKTRES
jgi:hypothetical protein